MNTGTIVAAAQPGCVVVVALAQDQGHLLLRVLKGAVPTKGSVVGFSVDDVRYTGHGQLQHPQGKSYVAYMGHGPRQALQGLLARHQLAHADTAMAAVVDASPLTD